MSTLAEVKLWGRTIGAVALEDGAVTSRFEYDLDFARSGIEVAPLMMPLSTQIYSFTALKRETFYGLPGLLANSLPDRFGLDDFKACASIALMKRGRSETIRNCGGSDSYYQ